MRTFPILLAFALAGCAWGSEASKLYAQARKAEKAGEVARAYLLYTEAAALEPENHLYWNRSLALQTRAALEGKFAPQLAAAAGTTPADPEPEPDTPPIPAATLLDLAETRKPLPPTELNATAGRKDFNLKADNKTLFQTVARAFGLDCVFDGDYKSGQPIHFQMDQADYREALHGLEAATGSFLVPISGRLFLVVKDTQQKRKEEEPYAAIAVPLGEAMTPQDLTAMVTAVQQACGIQKVAIDNARSMVVLRDSVTRVLAARELFQQLLHPRAEILLEMNFVEVSQSENLNYGFPLTSSFPLYSFSTFMQNAPQLAQNIAGALRFGFTGLIGIGIANLQLVASMTKSNATNLLHTSARSVDGQPASIHVGQKYPILTAGYFGPASFSGPNAYTPPPSFTFEDLGLSLKATPHVHGEEDVTLSIEAEFKVLAGQASNGIPIISNRSLKSDVTLKMGEWAVVAGLIDDEDARTLAGIAGLARIPIIGPITSSTTRNKSSDKVVILLRPTLVVNPPDESMTHVLRLGPEARPLTQM
ncbi:MAG: type II and III secretion system protein [Bryobacteraceae bacterium]